MLVKHLNVISIKCILAKLQLPICISKSSNCAPEQIKARVMKISKVIIPSPPNHSKQVKLHISHTIQPSNTNICPGIYKWYGKRIYVCDINTIYKCKRNTNYIKGNKTYQQKLSLGVNVNIHSLHHRRN